MTTPPKNGVPKVKVMALGSSSVFVARDALNDAAMAGFNRVVDTERAKRWVKWLSDRTLAHEAAHHPGKKVTSSERL